MPYVPGSSKIRTHNFTLTSPKNQDPSKKRNILLCRNKLNSLILTIYLLFRFSAFLALVVFFYFGQAEPPSDPRVTCPYNHIIPLSKNERIFFTKAIKAASLYNHFSPSLALFLDRHSTAWAPYYTACISRLKGLPFFLKPLLFFTYYNIVFYNNHNYTTMLAFLVTLLLLLQLAFAEPNMEELEGTWVSKSNTVFTGPGYYDPVDELLIEPALPGISYSFTKDGHYEEALYRITSNPRNHSCAIASMTFQHGSYEILSNGSVILTPIAVDGRQLLSDPCGYKSDEAKYVRYEQKTWFEKYQVSISDYHGRYMLQIYQFDGSPMQPLYLAYKPPMMLPTGALNPTDNSEPTKASVRKRVRRSLENQYRTNAVRETSPFFEKFYWVGVVVLGAGSAAMLLR